MPKKYRDERPKDPFTRVSLPTELINTVIKFMENYKQLYSNTSIASFCKDAIKEKILREEKILRDLKR